MGVDKDVLDHQKDYDLKHAEDVTELNEIIDELKLYEFVLSVSKCGGALYDKDGNLKASFIQDGKPAIRICRNENDLEIKFNDPTLQTRISRLMTPSSQKSLSK